jgi:hypothetical protein
MLQNVDGLNFDNLCVEKKKKIAQRYFLKPAVNQSLCGKKWHGITWMQGYM